MGLVLDVFLEKFSVNVEHLEILSRTGDTFLVTGNEIRLLSRKNKRNLSNLFNLSGTSTPDKPDPPQSDRVPHRMTAEYATRLAEELEKLKNILPHYDYRIRWSRESVEWYEDIRGIAPSNSSEGNGSTGNQDRNDWKQASKEWVQFDSDDDSGKQASNGGDLYGGNGTSGKKANNELDMIEGYGNPANNNLDQYNSETDKETSNDEFSNKNGTSCKQANPWLNMIEGYGKYGKPVESESGTGKETSNDENGISGKQARTCEDLSEANGNGNTHHRRKNPNRISADKDYDHGDDNEHDCLQ